MLARTRSQSSILINLNARFKSQIAWPYPRLFTSSSLSTACTIIRQPTTVLALFASVFVFQFPSLFSFSLESSLCPGALTSNLWLVTCFFLFENILIFSVLTSIPFCFNSVLLTSFPISGGVNDSARVRTFVLSF